MSAALLGLDGNLENFLKNSIWPLYFDIWMSNVVRIPRTFKVYSCFTLKLCVKRHPLLKHLQETHGKLVS